MFPHPIPFYLRFLWKHRYWPRINAPRTLTEKILWLMAWDSYPLRANVVDRIRVREFVHEKAPACKFPRHLWVGESLTLDAWNKLPKTFVLKANHGSHMTYIVDKANDTFDKLSKLSQQWPTKDYSQVFGEWVYRDTPRVLIVEEKLEIAGEVPPDWKFFCANGKVFLVMLNTNRVGDIEFDTFYSRDFTKIDNLIMAYDIRKTPDTGKPAGFDDAIKIAEQLSAPFDFIRVDLYLVNGSVYFGELTCFPSAGSDAIKPTAYDFEFGDKIILNKSFVIDKPRPIWASLSEEPV